MTTPHPQPTAEAVHHPAHYGGGANPYEAIKVIEAWDLGFCLGNTVKYIARAGRKGPALQDLRKAAWYLQREISHREQAEQAIEAAAEEDACAAAGPADEGRRWGAGR
jgi:hypothetical protein